MTVGRRKRVRASDLAQPKPYKGVGTLLLICVGLTLVVIYKVNMGDSAIQLMEAMGLDPQTQLPGSVLDRSPEGTVQTALMLRYRDAHHPDAMACGRPDTVGQYVLELRVDPQGKPTAASAAHDDLQDPAIGPCISQKAMNWPMPAVGGQGARVYIPFNFAPRRH